MIDSEDFIDNIPSECLKLGPLEKIKLALKLARVVVFFKGSIYNPKDEYSKATLDML